MITLPLTQLKSGQSAVIQGFSVKLSKHSRKLFQQLGIRQHMSITLIRRAPLGDPLELAIVDSHFSLRSCEAQYIYVSI